MQTRKNANPSSRSTAARRLFWGVMVLGHAPALLLAWRGLVVGEASALRLAVLAVSEIVFILKLFDVAWLRVRGGRGGVLAVTMAVVLLHAGVLRQVAVRGIDNPNAWCVLFVGSGAAAARRRLPQSLNPTATSCSRRHSRHRRRAAWSALAAFATAWLPPRFLLLRRAVSVNRAPPFSQPALIS